MILNILILAITLSSVVASSNSTSGAKTQKVCNALAMSGGGTYGAYQAGALWGMLYTDIYDKEKFEYHVVTGISSGSINLGGVGMFPIGDEERMVNVLSEKWANLTTKQIYVDWKPAGIVTGMYRESGIFDTAPLHEFLDNFYEEQGGKIYRKLGIGSVDVNSGNYVVFNETDPEPIKAIMASAAIQAVFPTIQFPERNMVMIDGGAAYVVDIFTAVKRCRELVDDDSQINIDVLVAGNRALNAWTDQNNAWGNQQRFQQIKTYHKQMGDLLKFMQAYPTANWRYFVMPSEPFPGTALNADNTTVTWPIQMQGRLDGENTVKSGEGFYFNKFKEYMSSPELKKEYPDPQNYVDKVIADQTEYFKQQRRRQNPIEEQFFTKYPGDSANESQAYSLQTSEPLVEKVD